ncbi:hypothetical protein KKB18_09605, partial [bacterium]|nr:hypothetical protein [bacterium]
MSISGKTKVFGLIGTPVENSYSPFIYNEAFKITGFDGRYVAFDVSSDYLANALDGIKALGISGINVTAPYKEKVMPFIDHISVTAKSIGAVNTILNEGGRLRGFNTDYIGFMRQLLDISSEFNKKKSWKFSILGAGGAARSVIYSLLFFLDYLSNNYREEAQNSFMGLDIDILTGKKIECINIVNRDQKKALNLKGMIDKLTKKEMIPVATILFNTENLADAVRNC